MFEEKISSFYQLEPIAEKNLATKLLSKLLKKSKVLFSERNMLVWEEVPYPTIVQLTALLNPDVTYEGHNDTPPARTPEAGLVLNELQFTEDIENVLPANW